ncbi:hypothetical protein QOZ80_4AG0325870 [Eleusine coracana subsp. coracana]|nr:hypothetical protein QOZ80_4AG0325870 [Eleusine coracana subsp. coracana]
MQQKSVIQDLLQQHLSRAKERMKRQVDAHRTERVFEEGDMVFLKLQPYVQSSLAPRSNQKLAFKFYGPYKILSQVGTVAYKLQLPIHSSIHPVFHVSQLKKLVGSEHSIHSDLPSSLVEFQVPEKILNHHMVVKGVQSIQQVLVKWSSWPASMATWEDLVPLKQTFPCAPTWGQAGAKGGEDVSTASQHQDPSRAVINTKPIGPRRSDRSRSTNIHVVSPDWVCG